MDFSARRRKPLGAPNITPLIDVVFILLIFFMLTSTFRIDRGIHVDLPTAESATQKPEPDIFTVAIDRAGEIYIETIKIELDGLPKRVRAFLDRHQDGRIVIRSDGGGSVQSLVSVMDKLREAKAENVTIATDFAPVKG